MTLSAFGMNLHAATTADGRDRKQLERICRYLLRPPFAHDAVTALPGGRVRVSFKAPWRSGTAHADMDAHQFLPVFQRLTEHLERLPAELRQFVEEQHAVVGQRNLARTGIGAAA